MRKTTGFLMLCGAVMAGMAAVAATQMPAAKPAKAVKPAATRVEVTYYHGNMRCSTCIAIETRSKEAVEQYFPKEIKKGTVVWSAVNFDEPVNAHYLEDYKLTTKSVVLSYRKKGKEVRYKVLNEVWQHIHGDPEQYKLFVKAEIEAMFRGPAK